MCWDRLKCLQFHLRWLFRRSLSKSSRSRDRIHLLIATRIPLCFVATLVSLAVSAKILLPLAGLPTQDGYILEVSRFEALHERTLHTSSCRFLATVSACTVIYSIGKFLVRGYFSRQPVVRTFVQRRPSGVHGWLQVAAIEFTVSETDIFGYSSGTLNINALEHMMKLDVDVLVGNSVNSLITSSTLQTRELGTTLLTPLLMPNAPFRGSIVPGLRVSGSTCVHWRM